MKQNSILLLLCLLMLASLVVPVKAASIFEERVRMQKKLEKLKQELVLIDYDKAEKMLKEIEELSLSNDDADKIKAYELLKAVQSILTESRPVETRAVWLDDQALGKINGPEELKKLVRSLADLNVNLILPNVYFAGESFHKSNIVPQMDWYRLAFGEEDPLEILIEEAHKYGIEVHAWVMVYGLQGNVEPFLDRLDWLDKDKDGKYNNTAHTDYFFSPAHPLARDHILAIIDEVAAYNLDGIHLDNIRYKDGFGYGDYMVDLYQQFFSIDPRKIPASNIKQINHFREFKAQFITSFVELVRTRLHEKNPHLMLSAATAPQTWGKNSLGQDWHNWIDNRSLHFVLPMSYIETPEEYAQLIASDIQRIAGKTYCFPGQALYAFSAQTMEKEWQEGQKAPITGQTLFSLLHIKPEHYELLQKGLFREKAVATFREPDKAAVLLIDWLKKRIETFGSRAGFNDTESIIWLNLLDKTADLIVKAPMRRYDNRDLREENKPEQLYWETVLESIEQLLELANNLKETTKKRLTIDLLQLRSFITPLEYTSRPFTLVPIKY